MAITQFNIFEESQFCVGFNITLVCDNLRPTSAKTVTYPDGFSLLPYITFNVLFVNGFAAANTAMTINGIPVKVNDNGTLKDLPKVGANNDVLPYGYVLPLYYDATNNRFIIVGNPILTCNSDYMVFANGTIIWNVVKNKISSELGLTATNYTGKATTAATADNALACSGNAVTATTADTAKRLRVLSGVPSGVQAGDIWIQ